MFASSYKTSTHILRKRINRFVKLLQQCECNKRLQLLLKQCPSSVFGLVLRSKCWAFAKNYHLSLQLAWVGVASALAMYYILQYSFQRGASTLIFCSQERKADERPIPLISYLVLFFVIQALDAQACSMLVYPYGIVHIPCRQMFGNFLTFLPCRQFIH